MQYFKYKRHVWIANGSASVIASGGSGGYSYLWSNGATTATITGLLGGTYSVVISDSNGCTTSCSVVVGTTNAPSCLINGVNATCGLPNGSASVSVSGGSGSYTYLWSTGANTSSVNGLIAGAYSVVVTDANGCTTSCHVNIAQTGNPVCSITGTDTYCAAATVTATGGSGVYSYSWSNGGTTPTITNLSGGNYTVTVVDANGCSTTCSILINSSSTVVCSASGTDATCGDPNGTVSVTASGGVGPYTYLWSSGWKTQQVAGLVGGTYTVTVTDSQGCTSVCSTTINSIGGPTCVATSTPSNCYNNDGTATAAANGGSGLYSYLWSTGSTLMTIDNLAPGNYTVTVTDGKGCQVVCNVNVIQSMTMCSGELGNKVWDDIDGDGLQSDNEPGIEFVKVRLYIAESHLLVDSLYTNAMGEYCFTELVEGNYYVKFDYPQGFQYLDYVVTGHVPMSISMNSDITDANGVNTTNTIFLAQGEVNKQIDAGFYQGTTIGNQVWCDTDNGIPNQLDSGDQLIEGVEVNLYKVDSLGNPSSEVFIGTTMTNSNGNYLINVNNV